MLMNFFNSTKLRAQRGIGLLELMLSIAIISLLLIMATRYYGNTQQGAKVTNTISMVGGLLSAEEQYASFNGGYTNDFSKLNLPVALKTGPWGGNVNITGTTASNVSIVISNIPTTPVDICVNYLQTIISNNTQATVGCSSGTMTVTYPAKINP